MPNWIEGCLKIRGNKEDILNFFRKNVNVYKFTGDGKGYNALDHRCWYNEDADPNFEDALIYIQDYDAYIEGTTRAFLDEQTIDVVPTHDHSTSIAVCRFCQAWGFEPFEFLKIALEYNIDIRAYGIESGEQFCQEFCIENGKLIFDRRIRYEDWQWECPFPYMGG